MSSALLTALLDEADYYEVNYYEMDKNRKISGDEIYVYAIFIGLQGSKLDYFHKHEATLLAEFYGEKIVFLATPFTDRELAYGASGEYKSSKLVLEAKRIIDKYYENSESDLQFNNNGDYYPFQQVVLRPGDVLYIPSGWYHKVEYLTPCIGLSQAFSLANMNLRDEL